MLVVSLGIINPAAYVSASSHREAPLLAADPQVDATDFYSFVSPDKPDTVTFVANYNPFEEPAGGPNFYKFSDTALYEIKVDNNGDAIPDVTYQFRFTTTRLNQNTFLYNTGPVNSLTDPNLNVRQTYTVTKVANGVSTVIAQDIPVAPANVGVKSMPNYAGLAAAAVSTTTTGSKVFAGPVDDPFFAELGGIFNLLTIRKLPGNMGGGVDGLAGYNVLTIALQVPIANLTSNGSVPHATTDSAAVIGSWTTASRQTTRVLNTDGSAPSNSGDWVQVSRLGAPLVNEAVIPAGMKDRFNASKPQDDAQFANYVTDPELAKLFKGIYNINVPPQGAFPGGRDDLVAIFLTGISGLTQPPNVKPSEELRLNVAVPPATSPNKFGVIGGDNAGFPNGRRLGDDVVDIALRAVAGAAYPLFHPGYVVDPTGAQLGDGVDHNDKYFQANFPYVALPWDGYSSIPHPSAYQPGTVVSTPMPPVSACPCYIPPGLRLGSRGQAVKDLQLCLKANGIYRAVPTGYFGTYSISTMASFRRIKPMCQ